MHRDSRYDQSKISFNEVLASFAHAIMADTYILAHATATFVSAESIKRGMDYSECERKKWNLPLLIDYLQGKSGGIRNVCVVGSPYCLMLYLLYVGDIRHTLFLFYGRYPLKTAGDVLRS